MKRLPLDGFWLKLLAMILMTVDHVGAFMLVFGGNEGVGMVLLKLLKDLIDGNDGIGDRDAVLKRCLDEVKGLSGLITGDNPPVFQGGIFRGRKT